MPQFLKSSIRNSRGHDIEKIHKILFQAARILLLNDGAKRLFFPQGSKAVGPRMAGSEKASGRDRILEIGV